MAQKRNVASYWYRRRWEVLTRDRWTCQYCGQRAPDVILHVDHVVPRARGGSDDLDNLVTSCSACNQGKADEHPAQPRQPRADVPALPPDVLPDTACATSVYVTLQVNPAGCTVTDLERSTGYSHRAIMYALKHLQDHGWVSAAAYQDRAKVWVARAEPD